jgi:hypothetical protein
MSQVLKSLQLVTQSYNGTPSTGTGALFASGSTLYFENAASTTFPLGTTGGGSGYIIVREYTGSAPGGGTLTPTWNNNSSIKYIQVICVGGGGGGGGGVVRNQGIQLTGGAGGGGGAIAWGFFNSASLTQASYNIVVGAGGAGGAGRTTVATGGTGANGGYTTFGETLVSASGGGGGTGGGTGTAVGGTGGQATACRPGPGFAIPGGTGGQTGTTGGNTIPPSTFFGSPLIPISTAGGGGGESLTNAGVTITASTGSSGVEWNTLKLNNAVLSGSGTSNLVTAAVLLQFTSSVFTTTYGLGGGGNGAPISASISRRGGDAGSFGAGGGGASPYPNSTTGPSQPGGSGSSGLCIVVEYY